MALVKYTSQTALSYQQEDAAEPTSLVFRPMELTDLDTVAAIERVSFPTPYTRPMFLDELDESQRCSWWVVRPEPLHPGQGLPPVVSYIGYTKLGKRAHVAKIATHPDWRRHRLGEWTLLNGLLAAYAERASYVTLEVRASNIAAQRLYRKWGFFELQRIRQYYEDTGEDGLILAFRDLDAKLVVSWLHQKQGQIVVSYPGITPTSPEAHLT